MSQSYRIIIFDDIALKNILSVRKITLFSY